MAPLSRKARLVLAAGAAGSASAYTWFYLTRVCKLPTLHFGEGPLARLVLEECPLLLRPYSPSPWAISPHAQTLLTVARGFYLRPGYHRELLRCEDGGTVALDWFRGCHEVGAAPAAAPILLVLHGLTGGSSEGYCKVACGAASARGWRAVVLNYRGCAGLPLTSPRCYSAAFTDDVHLAVERIQARFPAARLVAAGYSLGALILAKYLAEADSGHWRGTGSGIAAAALLSSPLCLHSASAGLSRPWTPGWLYNLGLALRLKAYYREHQAQLGHEDVHLSAVAEAFTISHFDTAVVTRIFGYKDLDAYYTDGSSRAYIPRIRTPCLFLVACDDPFLGRLPLEECRANPHTVLAVTERGGHVAFLEGLWPFGESWMDGVSLQFLTACLRRFSPRRRPQGDSMEGTGVGDRPPQAKL